MIKQMLCTTAAAISMSSLSAYTVVNQSSEEKEIVLQEVYRPQSEVNGGSKAPLPLNDNPKKLTIPVGEEVHVDIEPCSLLQISVITTSTHHEKNEEGEVVKTRCTTKTSETLIRPSSNPEEANEWGLLFIDADPSSFTYKYVKYKTVVLEPAT